MARYLSTDTITGRLLPTTPVHVAHSREPRAIDFARHADLNGQWTLISQLCGRCKHRHAETAADCRFSAPPPAVTRPYYRADASLPVSMHWNLIL